jgi:hypothetical protein
MLIACRQSLRASGSQAFCSAAVPREPAPGGGAICAVAATGSSSAANKIKTDAAQAILPLAETNHGSRRSFAFIGRSDRIARVS